MNPISHTSSTYWCFEYLKRLNDYRIHADTKILNWVTEMILKPNRELAEDQNVENDWKAKYWTLKAIVDCAYPSELAEQKDSLKKLSQKYPADFIFDALHAFSVIFNLDYETAESISSSLEQYKDKIPWVSTLLSITYLVLGKLDLCKSNAEASNRQNPLFFVNQVTLFQLANSACQDCDFDTLCKNFYNSFNDSSRASAFSLREIFYASAEREMALETANAWLQYLYNPIHKAFIEDYVLAINKLYGDKERFFLVALTIIALIQRKLYNKHVFIKEDILKLALDSIQKHPWSDLSHICLGLALIKNAYWENALSYLISSLELKIPSIHELVFIQIMALKCMKKIGHINFYSALDLHYNTMEKFFSLTHHLNCFSIEFSKKYPFDFYLRPPFKYDLIAFRSIVKDFEKKRLLDSSVITDTFIDEACQRLGRIYKIQQDNFKLHYSLLIQKMGSLTPQGIIVYTIEKQPFRIMKVRIIQYSAKEKPRETIRYVLFFLLEHAMQLRCLQLKVYIDDLVELGPLDDLPPAMLRLIDVGYQACADRLVLTVNAEESVIFVKAVKEALKKFKFSTPAEEVPLTP